MSNYIIFADSACDLEPQHLLELGVKHCDLTLTFNEEGKEYPNSQISPKVFYDRMRNGETAKTSAVNMDSFIEAFTPYLNEGNDILYIAFSSGLSTTFNSGRLAAEELKEKFPDRKILAVDSLAASAGYGLLVALAAEQQKNGKTIDEVAAFVTKTVPNVCHWFTVDDLTYLKRGGRISPAVAFVGSLLGIKPVLHVDNEGHLVNVTKVRGRKAAIKALADKFGELALDKTGGHLYISHADVIEDANTLSDIILNDYGIKTELTVNVGPVIGAHSGPGTLAFFFLGKER